MKYVFIILLIGTAFPSIFFLLAALDAGNFKSYIFPIVLFLIPPIVFIILLLRNWNNKTYQWIAVVYIILMLILLIDLIISTKRNKNAEIASLERFADEKKGVYLNNGSKISVTGTGFNKNNLQYLSVLETIDPEPERDLQLYSRNWSKHAVFSETSGCRGYEYVFEADDSLTVNSLVESGVGRELKCNKVNIGNFIKSGTNITPSAPNTRE